MGNYTNMFVSLIICHFPQESSQRILETSTFSIAQIGALDYDVLGWLLTECLEAIFYTGRRFTNLSQFTFTKIYIYLKINEH